MSTSAKQSWSGIPQNDIYHLMYEQDGSISSPSILNSSL